MSQENNKNILGEAANPSHIDQVVKQWINNEISVEQFNLEVRKEAQHRIDEVNSSLLTSD